MICCSYDKRENDDNDPMYGVVLEIGHYRYRPLTAEWLGRSISLIPPPILRRKDEGIPWEMLRPSPYAPSLSRVPVMSFVLLVCLFVCWLTDVC